MALLVQCPTCGHTATFHRAPVQRCPQCESAYSEAIGVAAENALRHDLAPKPALLLIGQGICAFAGCLFLVFIPLAALNIGSYSIGHRPVTGAAFLRVGGPAFGLVGGWFVAIALGLWRDKPWSRPLMLAYWPVSTAVGIALVWNDPDLVMNSPRRASSVRYRCRSPVGICTTRTAPLRTSTRARANGRRPPAHRRPSRRLTERRAPDDLAARTCRRSRHCARRDDW